MSAKGFLEFVNSSPSPYHAVHTAITYLEKAGFVQIKEKDEWCLSVKAGGRYYLTRNASSLVAFAVGKKWKPGNPIAMLGTHTDSPCMRIKPCSKKTTLGYMQVGVEMYGGGLWHTWFDRDLSVAGRIMCRESSAGSGGSTIVQKLVKINKPILRIPNLAVHLNRSPDFSPNKETDMVPIAALAADELNGNSKDNSGASEQANTAVNTESKDKNGDPKLQPSITDRHHPEFLQLVAKEANVEVDNILDFELVLYDTQAACVGGLHDEFILSPRLDNLNMTYCGLMALINSSADSSSLEHEPGIRLFVAFDHEEIGSVSAQGAHSSLLGDIVTRLSMISAASGGGPESIASHAAVTAAVQRSIAQSLLVSADMAHAVHPNYASKHESLHQPRINNGVVLKVNSNQRYATNSAGIVVMQEVARREQVGLQYFVIRNDAMGGSTIGPGLAAKLGVRTVDLGNPQLSMHSIREMGGVKDIESACKLFGGFLKYFGGELAQMVVVD